MTNGDRYYTMSAEERDRVIWALRQRKVPMHKIAKRVGMSPSGVCRALDRMKAGRAGLDRRE